MVVRSYSAQPSSSTYYLQSSDEYIGQRGQSGVSVVLMAFAFIWPHCHWVIEICPKQISLTRMCDVFWYGFEAIRLDHTFGGNPRSVRLYGWMTPSVAL